MSLSDYPLLAKQYIYNAGKHRVGEELLFRSPIYLSVRDVGSDVATKQVLVNYCACITESVDLKHLPVYLNVDVDFLLSQKTLPVEPSKIFLEVNGVINADSVLKEALLGWTQQGFRLVLSGFNFSPEHVSLLPQFDSVKVNMLGLTSADLEAGFEALPKKSGQAWIASKIESETVFLKCLEQGFDLFQGYFLARPVEVKGASIRPGTAVTIRIVNALEKPGSSMDQIAELVSQDPMLAVQMLKIINSPLFALPKKIVDLKSALVFLGLDMLRHWAMILAFLSNGSLHIEASRVILMRAKTCELFCLTDSRTATLASMAFLAGLVSGVVVLLKVTPAMFLAEVKLSAELSSAVLEYAGELGVILNNVLAHEAAVALDDQAMHDADVSMFDAGREADRWADQVISILKS